MLYRLIAQSDDTFYSALCEGSTITHFRSPFGVYSIDEVFSNNCYRKRDSVHIDNVSRILKNVQATNHILIPADLTYSQFLDQYPEWNI